MRSIAISLLTLFAAACGNAAAPSDAGAQPAASAGLTSADRTAILSTQNLSANAQGLVENECGERVQPDFKQVDLGGGVGQAVLLVMTGGPNSASCYGDGPGLTLLARDGAGWRTIYFSRGGYMAVMPTRTQGVADLAFAGPGFEHPLSVWNGHEYVGANRSISDDAMNSATILP